MKHKWVGGPRTDAYRKEDGYAAAAWLGWRGVDDCHCYDLVIDFNWFVLCAPLLIPLAKSAVSIAHLIQARSGVPDRLFLNHRRFNNDFTCCGGAGPFRMTDRRQ